MILLILFQISVGIIILVSIGGNVLVCIAVCQDRKLRKPSNSLYVSLAIADLLLSIFVMPFAAVNELNFNWMFSYYYCKTFLSLDVMCCTASILNICAIAFDRYYHVRDPFHYVEKMTKWAFISMLIFIWLCSGIISFLPINLNWHAVTNYQSSVSPDNNATMLFECTLHLNITYAIVSSTISYFIPCICLLFLYFKLYREATRHAQVIHNQNKYNVSSCISSDYETFVSNSSPGPNKVSKKWNNSDHKAAITLGIITGTFLFCWTPFFIINVTGTFCQCISNIIFSTLTWLGYLNSSLNPIIYTVFNAEFRNAFKRILSCYKFNLSSVILTESLQMNPTLPANRQQKQLIHPNCRHPTLKASRPANNINPTHISCENTSEYTNYNNDNNNKWYFNDKSGSASFHMKLSFDLEYIDEDR